MVIRLGPSTTWFSPDEITVRRPRRSPPCWKPGRERQTTIGGVNHQLPDSWSAATQNPIEEEGTYVAPEAQDGGFLLKRSHHHPTPVEEFEVFSRMDSGQMTWRLRRRPDHLDDVRTLQEARRRVYVHETLKAYIVDIINTTRGRPQPAPGRKKHVRVGTLHRPHANREAIALMEGRNHVMPTSRKCATASCVTASSTFDAVADNVSIRLRLTLFKAVPVP